MLRKPVVLITGASGEIGHGLVSRLGRDPERAIITLDLNPIAPELAPLVRMIQPRFGLITNIGREHLEFFGSVEGVVEEEGTLAELLPASGKLFLNGDSEWTATLAVRSPAPLVTVGFGERNDWRARRVWVGETGAGFEVAAPRPAWHRCCGSHAQPAPRLRPG